MTDDWVELPELTVARYAHSSVTIDKVVYVIAGTAAGEHLNSIEWLSLANKGYFEYVPSW